MPQGSFLGLRSGVAAKIPFVLPILRQMELGSVFFSSQRELPSARVVHGMTAITLTNLAVVKRSGDAVRHEDPKGCKGHC